MTYNPLYLFTFLASLTLTLLRHVAVILKYLILYVPSLQQYTFVKCDVEGAEAEVAAKLARYGVSLRQYKKSLMEEELLPTRIRYKVSLEMLLSVERIVFTYMKTGLSWTYFTSSSSATGTQHKGSHQPL